MHAGVVSSRTAVFASINLAALHSLTLTKSLFHCMLNYIPAQVENLSHTQRVKAEINHSAGSTSSRREN